MYWVERMDVCDVRPSRPGKKGPGNFKSAPNLDDSRIVTDRKSRHDMPNAFTHITSAQRSSRGGCRKHWNRFGLCVAKSKSFAFLVCGGRGVLILSTADHRTAFFTNLPRKPGVGRSRAHLLARTPPRKRGSDPAKQPRHTAVTL